MVFCYIQSVVLKYIINRVENQSNASSMIVTSIRKTLRSIKLTHIHTSTHTYARAEKNIIHKVIQASNITTLFSFTLKYTLTHYYSFRVVHTLLRFHHFPRIFHFWILAVIWRQSTIYIGDKGKPPSETHNRDVRILFMHLSINRKPLRRRWNSDGGGGGILYSIPFVSSDINCTA